MEITKIKSMDEVRDGMIIQAICEDGKSRIGVVAHNAAGEIVLIPWDAQIPLGQRKPYTRKSEVSDAKPE